MASLKEEQLMPKSLVPTHPWLSFQLDLRQIPSATWVQLGECSSKIQHISGVPLKPAIQRSLDELFLAKGAHATTAIEGNTLSEDQVRRRLEGHRDLPKSQEYLGREVDNIISAYGTITDGIAAGAPFEICADDLKRLNAAVLEGLELQDDVIPGEFRQHTVGVGDYLSPTPEYNQLLVDRLCEWMNHPVWSDTMGASFVLPILKAIMAHLYIAWIHPFGDGNGRTARLVEFDILTRVGVPTISAHLLSNHYNKTRGAYYRALSAARENQLHFVTYAVEGFVDALREQIQTIRLQQILVAWQDYVYEVFSREPRTVATDRRRKLVIALSWQNGPVPRSHLNQLTTALAAEYANTTPKTLSRDINALLALDMIREEPAGIAANTGRILAFLPLIHPQRDRWTLKAA